MTAYKQRPKELVTVEQWSVLLLAENNPQSSYELLQDHLTPARNLSQKGYGKLKGRKFYINAKGRQLVRD